MQSGSTIGINSVAQRAYAMGLFGDLIRDLRKERRWSQDRLARLVGMSKQGVLNLERYDDIRVRGETFDKLAGAFGKTADELTQLYEDRRRDQSRYEITISNDAGRVFRFPKEWVDKLAAMAEAEGQPFMEWFFDLTAKHFQTTPPNGHAGSREAGVVLETTPGHLKEVEGKLARSPEIGARADDRPSPKRKGQR